MSTYYIWADDKSKQYIDPSQVGDGGIKLSDVTYGDSARLAAWAMATRKWSAPILVGDDTGEKEKIVGCGFQSGEYQNVTLDFAKEFNDFASRSRVVAPIHVERKMNSPNDPKIREAMMWYERECSMAMKRPGLFVHPVTGVIEVRPNPDYERIAALKKELNGYGLRRT